MPHLEELSLGNGWGNNFWFPDLLKDETLLGSGIKRIHIKSFKRFIAPFIASSSICALTHLSLNAPSFGSLSPFEMVLKYGRNLRSLRIKGNLDPMTSHSQYFRRYTHALPYLTEFGIYVSIANGPHFADTDFFPAICDFLIPKAAQLIHLELTAPHTLRGREKLGFDGGKWCWGMLKPSHSLKTPFPKLESLSMTLPAGHKSFSIHYSKLIPKGLTTLTLSGEQLLHKFTKIFAVVRFPPESIITISDRFE
jgi:hypothetical protein